MRDAMISKFQIREEREREVLLQNNTLGRSLVQGGNIYGLDI